MDLNALNLRRGVIPSRGTNHTLSSKNNQNLNTALKALHLHKQASGHKIYGGAAVAPASRYQQNAVFNMQTP
jgi:hypothetical protein